MRNFIVSGHHTQSIEFARTQGWKLSDWVLLQGPTQMRGIPIGEGTVYLVGTYKQHRGLEAILLEAKIRNFKVVEA